MSLIPENTMERILNGEDVTPSCRAEYFVKQAIDNAGSGGGGGELPTPGTAGNVLTSTGTAWESAAPADATALEFSLTIGESITCDEAVADIVNALETNRPVMGVVEGVGTLVVKTWSAELNKVVLLLYIPDSNKLTVVEFNGTSGTPDTWAMDDPNEIKGLPAASASNNGQVLGVENGVYALVSPSALNDYVVTLTVTVDPDTQDATMSTDNKSVAEINAAIEAGKNVYAELEEEINGVTMMQRFYPTMYCATMIVFGGNLVAAGGSGFELDPVCIVGVHAGNMDTWSAVGN